MDLDEFLAAFIGCTLPKAEWTHAAHVTVAAAWIWEDAGTALDRLRDAIRKYNESIGGQNTVDAGYHETLTRFWVMQVAEAMPVGLERNEAVRHVVAQLGGDSGRFRRYYSFDIVKSREARATWVPPDLLG